MGVSKIAVAIVMACMVMSGRLGQVEGKVTCEQVTIWLTPCISYAVMGGEVSSLCCQGIYSLNAAYKNADDRRGSCQCIKDKAAHIPGINYDRVNAIAAYCGTTCPYKVYPTTDCSKVN